MRNEFIHIAISADALAELIEEGAIHLMDFKCLNKHAKNAVWRLLLTTLGNKINNPRSVRHV